MAALNQKERKPISKALGALSTGYHDNLSMVVELIAGNLTTHDITVPDIEGGCILCGESARVTFELNHTDKGELDNVLVLSWHHMPSGRYEINAYVS